MTGVIDMNQKLKLYTKTGIAAAALAGTQMAHADAFDYSTLTATVDWSSVGAGLLAVGVAIIGINVVFKGIKLVVRAVKGA